MSISVTSPYTAPVASTDARSSAVIKRSAAPAAAEPSAAPSARPDVVTSEEKQYFAALFPKDAEAIRSYAGYSPAGMKQAVRLGTIIDMKG